VTKCGQREIRTNSEDGIALGNGGAGVKRRWGLSGAYVVEKCEGVTRNDLKKGNQTEQGKIIGSRKDLKISSSKR